MSPGSTSEEQPPAHVTIEADAEPHHASGSLTNANGWDGKLRMPKSAILTNPEAVSDPEYSDDENVLPGEEIAADEGESFSLCICAPRKSTRAPSPANGRPLTGSFST